MHLLIISKFLTLTAIERMPALIGLKPGLQCIRTYIQPRLSMRFPTGLHHPAGCGIAFAMRLKTSKDLFAVKSEKNIPDAQPIYRAVDNSPLKAANQARTISAYIHHCQLQTFTVLQKIVSWQSFNHLNPLKTEQEKRPLP